MVGVSSVSMIGPAMSKMVTYDVLQRQGHLPKVSQIDADEIPHTVSGNRVSSDFRPLQRRLGVSGGGSGGASKAQPRDVVSAASEEPKTILRRGVKNSG